MTDASNAIFESLSDSVDQTAAVGRAIAAFTQPGDTVALIGELGAGKTQLVRGLAHGLGIDAATVSSPTFVLMQQYTHPRGNPVVLHIDAYRLAGLEDAESIGWDTDILSDAIVVVEWADRIADQLPDDRLEVRLSHAAQNQRGVRIQPFGAWKNRMNALRTEIKRCSTTSRDRQGAVS